MYTIVILGLNEVQAPTLECFLNKHDYPYKKDQLTGFYISVDGREDPRLLPDCPDLSSATVLDRDPEKTERSFHTFIALVQRAIIGSRFLDNPSAVEECWDDLSRIEKDPDGDPETFALMLLDRYNDEVYLHCVREALADTVPLIAMWTGLYMVEEATANAIVLASVEDQRNELLTTCPELRNDIFARDTFLIRDMRQIMAGFPLAKEPLTCQWPDDVIYYVLSHFEEMADWTERYEDLIRDMDFCVQRFRSYYYFGAVDPEDELDIKRKVILELSDPRAMIDPTIH